MKDKITRNGIWLVDLDPVIGHEQAKRRPCLVVSAETFNSGPYKLAVIVPITSQFKPISWFVPINISSGLKKISYIICNQPRTVSYDRFGDYIGNINSETMAQVEMRLRFLLGL